MKKEKSDGSTANYYQLPEGATQLQDLISFKDMNAQIGEIFRAAYRYGQVEHSARLRDAKKIKFYIEAEIERLEKYGEDEIRPQQEKKVSLVLERLEKKSVYEGHDDRRFVESFGPIGTD